MNDPGTTFAKDQSTSITRFPHSYIKPLDQTFSRERKTSVSGTLVRSPEFTIEKIPQKESPKPTSQLQSSGSTSGSDHSPSKPVQFERPSRLFNNKSRKTKYELVREIGKTNNSVYQTELVSYQDFVVCRDSVPCCISLDSRIYHLMRNPCGCLFYKPIE